MTQRPRPPAPVAPVEGDRLPPRGPARTRMLRALARMLWLQEREERRLRALREVGR